MPVRDAPGIELSLPWDEVATPPSSDRAPGDTLRLPVPAIEPTPGEHPPPAPPSPPAPSTEDGGGWLRSIIDPPRPAAFSGPPSTQIRDAHAPGPAQPSAWNPDARTGRLDLSAGPVRAGLVAPVVEPPAIITTIEPTPAMRAVLTTQGYNDPIGDVIEWGASRLPAIDEILDRYCPNGKIGRVPLGIAAAGALTLILLLAGQPWPATVLTMVVVVLYGMPRIGAALSASERARFQANHATGIAHIRRDLNGGLARLTFVNGPCMV